MGEGLTILLAGLGLALVVAVFFARQMAFRIIGSVLRVLTWPIRVVFRLFGIGRQAPGSELAPSAFAATARFFRPRTDTENALGDDFEHEKQFISTTGWLFRWMGVRVGFMRMPESLTEALAEEYFERSKEFLSARVPIDADPKSLFEDIEGAVIVERFHKSDKGIYYLLNEARKTINTNVRRLTVWFSFILSAVLMLNILYNDGQIVDFTAIFNAGGLPIGAQAFNSLLFGLITTLGGAVVMWLLYATGYGPFQRNNTREMANFLTRYLARINDHYRTAVGKANSVTVGEERDTGALAKNATRWTLMINWLAMRAFFIESYVRNVKFQIVRNTSYYLLFVPLTFILAIIVILSLLSTTGAVDPLQRIADLGWVIGVLFLSVAVVYVLFLLNSLRCLEEIDQGEWISFHTLKLDEVMAEIVGKYAGEVGYWKNRVGGGI